MKDIYKISECIYCKQIKATKNDICLECERFSKKIEIPDIFKDIFNIKE